MSTFFPASFVTFTPLRKTRKKGASHITITELSVREEPVNIYDIKMQEMRQRFNNTYYKFLSKITVITSHAHLLKFHEKDVRSLFTDLVEMRIMLEKSEEKVKNIV